MYGPSSPGKRSFSRRVIAIIGVAMLMVMVMVLAPTAVTAESLSFENVVAGGSPGDFELAVTGDGQQGNWQVVVDETAREGKALAQLSQDKTDYRYPLAIYRPLNVANVEMTAWFRAVSGVVDQAAGVVVRYADADNYYVARANALEDNVGFYRVVNGDRQQLASANVKIAASEWHGLMLHANGDQFTVSFNGKVVLTVADGTFRSAGRVGLWTKADSVIHFDWIIVRAMR